MNAPDIIKLVVEGGSLSIVLLILYGFYRLAREFLPKALALGTQLAFTGGQFVSELRALQLAIDALGHRTSAIEDRQVEATGAAKDARDAAEDAAEKVERISTGQHHAVTQAEIDAAIGADEARHVRASRSR